ncbi:FAD binding domain-containing protein [Bordetella petrii]|uniref:FAD binding domain-containing protein n=1 Tax=Bordetella petrii TaxID=94624 RepID=UPI001E469D53|nr:FAD binding domain-containing protein [Bordetella petrii]MCD0504468.1 FAD binding domain-containing protein [Bordetella petrii]
MKLPDFEYRAPSSLPEAVETLAALGSDAKLLAGGQSLLPAMRYRLSQPGVLLDLGRVAELRLAGDALRTGRIGAMSTHAQFAHNDCPSPLGRLLAEHARQIAFPAVRTRGTVGGSVVHADPAGDWPLLFLALDAKVELHGQRGTRSEALSDFIAGPMQTGIALDEILTAVLLDAPARDLTHWGRSKLMHRAGEYAVSSAVAVRRADGAWSCWIGAIESGPASMAACAEMLAATPRPTSQALLACAVEDARRACPELGQAAIHRHAINLARAITQALELT